MLHAGLPEVLPAQRGPAAAAAAGCASLCSGPVAPRVQDGVALLAIGGATALVWATRIDHRAWHVTFCFNSLSHVMGSP